MLTVLQVVFWLVMFWLCFDTLVRIAMFIFLALSCFVGLVWEAITWVINKITN